MVEESLVPSETKEVVTSPFSAQARLTLRRSSYEATDFAPSSEAGIDCSQLACELDRINAYRMILDTSLAPKLEGAASPTPRFIKATWSPRGMLFYERCLLATLTNLGAVNVVYSFNHSWVVLMDLSEYWVNYSHTFWSPVHSMKPDDAFALLKERAYHLKTTQIAWSRAYGTPEEKYCFLTMAQKDGTIVIWRLMSEIGRRSTFTPPYLLVVWNTHMENIQSLRWISVDDHTAWLAVGDLSGTVKMWHIDLAAEILLNIDSPLGIWLEADLMRVMAIVECAPPENATKTEVYLALAKANFVVGILVDLADPDNVLVLNHARRLGGEVKGMQPMRLGSLAVATEKIDLCIFTFTRPERDRLNFSLRTIPYVNVGHMACHGLASSKNHALWVTQLCVNKMYDHLILRQPSLTTFFTLTPSNGLAQLVENPSQSLSEYWDCLESVRLGHLMGEPPPPLDVGESDLETLSDYQLRLTLWLATISELRPQDDTTYQEQSKSVEPRRIRILVFARHACARMKDILTTAMHSGGTLTQLDLMSIHLLRAWLLELRQMCLGDISGGIEDNAVWPSAAAIAENILSGSSGLEELIQETCSVCGGEIESNKGRGPDLEHWRFAVCRKGHRTGRCSASLVQLTVPYYACCICKAVVHSYFVSSAMPVCIYCDGVLRADERIK